MHKNPAELWNDVLKNAKVYEDWEEAAYQLDTLLGTDIWYLLYLVCWHS